MSFGMCFCVCFSVWVCVLVCFCVYMYVWLCVYDFFYIPMGGMFGHVCACFAHVSLKGFMSLKVCFRV